MSDIVERLRANMDDDAAWRGAQDIIAALDAEITRLRAALAAQQPPPGWRLVPDKLLWEAFSVMRECGWQLAIGCEPESDGVLEAACTEIHDQFKDLLAAAPQPSKENDQ